MSRIFNLAIITVAPILTVVASVIIHIFFFSVFDSVWSLVSQLFPAIVVSPDAIEHVSPYQVYFILVLMLVSIFVNFKEFPDLFVDGFWSQGGFRWLAHVVCVPPLFFAYLTTQRFIETICVIMLMYISPHSSYSYITTSMISF